MLWHGVLPAVTTQFTPEGGLDHAANAQHAAWMAETGCKAIVALGSLGEGATLDRAEKGEVLAACLEGVSGRIPVVASVSALSTHEAVEVARLAESLGCQGLMVLPPYVHKGPNPEIHAHFSAVLKATELACMLYNNPVAYGTDVRPDEATVLLDSHPNLVAWKESSGDVRRVTELKARFGDRLAISVGVDDLIVEGIAAGAVGWVAGLVNAFPLESVKLFDVAMSGQSAQARTLYEWFLPLLRLDVRPDFVQAIKLVQQEVGRGHERVRLPRLPLDGGVRDDALAVLAAARRAQPAI